MQKKPRLTLQQHVCDVLASRRQTMQHPLTQRQLATALQAATSQGWSQARVSGLLAGKGVWPLDTLKAAAEILGLHFEVLLLSSAARRLKIVEADAGGDSICSPSTYEIILIKPKSEERYDAAPAAS